MENLQKTENMQFREYQKFMICNIGETLAEIGDNNNAVLGIVKNNLQMLIGHLKYALEKNMPVNDVFGITETKPLNISKNYMELLNKIVERENEWHGYERYTLESFIETQIEWYFEEVYPNRL